MADDPKTESPLDKFKATMKGLLNEVLDERAAKTGDEKKTGDDKRTGDTAKTGDDGGEKKSDWLGGLFGG